MADREEFSFEEEENPSGDSDISWMDQGEDSEIPAAGQGRRKGSMTRILLLVLLLITAGAAGFHFVLETPASTEPRQPALQVAEKKQPIAVPSRPPQETPPFEKESEPAAEAAAPQVPPPVEEKVLPEKSTEVVQSVPGEKPRISTPVEAPEKLAAATGDYTVAAGAFLIRSNLAEAERKVHESGFVPQVVQKKRKMEMTRLRVGTFPLQEGKKKVEEVAELAPDAFSLPVDGGLAVYAASFHNLDKARVFADRLYKKGLRVEEEYAQVEIPLYFLSFGGFPDLESARKAAEQARGRGLDTIVVKKP